MYAVLTTGGVDEDGDGTAGEESVFVRRCSMVSGSSAARTRVEWSESTASDTVMVPASDNTEKL